MAAVVAPHERLQQVADQEGLGPIEWTHTTMTLGTLTMHLVRLKVNGEEVEQAQGRTLIGAKDDASRKYLQRIGFGMD